MKTLTQHLVQYATYHRDVRNIATHFVGIPMIVLAVTTLLSRPGFELAGLALSPAVLLALAAGLFYLVLDRFTGVLMSGVLLLSVWFGHWAAAQTTPVWLAIGIGGFVVGWIIQFIGHYYEGRKPAFVDDMVGLLIGPLFVLAETLFMLGQLPDLKHEVERLAGPMRRGGAPKAPKAA